MLYSFILKGVSSILSFNCRYRQYGTADAQMLQLNTHCWHAHVEPLFETNHNGIFRS